MAIQLDTPAVQATVATVIPGLGWFISARLGGGLNVGKWYDELKKPDWRPPNWAFGPVWTTLYASMGAASYLVWRDGGEFSESARTALALYGTQLVLNWTWSPIFFGRHDLKLSLMNIIVQTGTVYATTFTFYRINKYAGYLMMPLCAWLTLASTLNYCVYRDNKDATNAKETKED